MIVFCDEKEDGSAGEEGERAPEDDAGVEGGFDTQAAGALPEPVKYAEAKAAEDDERREAEKDAGLMAPGDEAIGLQGEASVTERADGMKNGFPQRRFPGEAEGKKLREDQGSTDSFEREREQANEFDKTVDEGDA